MNVPLVDTGILSPAESFFFLATPSFYHLQEDLKPEPLFLIQQYQV
jgi:hypothetical protein